MTNNVIPFRCHQFTEVDLEFLAELMARLTTAGLISGYERQTSEGPPQVDCIVITLPGGGSPELSIERRGDGLYWLMALGERKAHPLAFGRTVDKVCRDLIWWDRAERHGVG